MGEIKMIFWYLNGKPLKNFNINTIIEGKTVILFGADEGRNKPLLEEIGKANLTCIFDNDKKKWNKDYMGIPIVKPFDGGKEEVILSGIYDWKSIMKQSHKMGYLDVYFFLTEEVEERMGNYVAEFSPEIYDNSIRGNCDCKYIHVIPDEKFFLPVTEYIEYGFHMKEHFFVVYMNCGNNKDRYDVWKVYKRLSKQFHNIYLLHEECFHLNLFDWDENQGELDKLLENADKIIFHGEFFVPTIHGYFRNKTDLIRKKGIFLPWAGRVGRNPNTNVFIEDVLQYARVITYTYPIEKESVTKNFPLTKKAVWMRNGISYARLTQFVPRTEKAVKNVLIAHSCHDYTKAMDTLKYLSKTEKNYYIYCITSYGPKELKEQIKHYGEAHFGSYFIAVDFYMDYTQYVQFLSQMDAAIFGMETLSGRDTLELLFWLGAKVYLKPDSEASKNMRYVGYKVNDYYSANRETLEELFYNPDEPWNHSIAMKQFDSAKKVQQWKELYEYDLDTNGNH